MHKGATMSQIENKEASKLKDEIKEDVKFIFEKYLSVSGWDIPENDEKASAKLILSIIKETVNELEASL